MAESNILTLKHLELDTLLDITNAINRQQDEQSLLKIFLFTLIANFKINKLMVCSRERGSWYEILRHGLPKEFVPDVEELKAVAENFTITRFKDSELALKNEFEVSIPVGRESRTIALILLGTTAKMGGEMNEESLKFIQTISNIIVVAIQNIRLTNRRLEQQAIKKEMEIARKLQSLLFPQNLPVKENIKITAKYIPQLIVGGDYYDYIELNENEFIVCIADVSGKGVGAAFIMSNLQSALRILAKQGLRLEQIVAELNTTVYNNARGEKFVTFFIAKYMLQKDKMVYINCGHNAPLFYNNEGNFELLDKGSVILGAFENLPIVETGRIHGIANSVLFCYTDGLVETVEYTNTDAALEQVKQLIKDNLIPEKLNDEVLQKLKIEGENSIDDITILTCALKNLEPNTK